METIKTILYDVLYVGISSFLIILFLSVILSDIRQLRNWAFGVEEEEDLQDQQK